MNSRAWVSLIALLTSAGCGGDDAPTGAGAGDPDAGGAATGQDSGPLMWTPRDSGPPPAPLDEPAPTPDGGLAGRMCAMARTPLPAAILPRCAAETADCIEACTTDADPDTCRETCIAADTTPAETVSMYGIACDSCIYLQLFACIDAAGCHDGVAEVFCCLEELCPAGSPEGCGEQRCGDKLMAAFTCGYYAKMECLQLTQELAGQCFPPRGDADGGT